MDHAPPVRRLRTAPPQPRSVHCAVTEADGKLLEALARHGPLPSSYLYEFTKHLRRDRTYLQHRLTEFYNGDARGPLLTRPPQQFASYRARYQHLVYDLAPRAHRVLAERGTTYCASRNDPFVHRLMSACVGASLELSAPRHGLRYIPCAEILARAPQRATVLGHSLALPVSASSAAIIAPDLLFGLEYPGAGFRFFAVEIDRNTESIDRRNLHQSAFARKIAAYGTALRDQTFWPQWHIPNLHVLTVTTSTRHATNILVYVAAQGLPACRERFAIKADATFGADWRVPSDLLTHLLAEAWNTTSGQRVFSRA